MYHCHLPLAKLEGLFTACPRFCTGCWDWLSVKLIKILPPPLPIFFLCLFQGRAGRVAVSAARLCKHPMVCIAEVTSPNSSPSCLKCSCLEMQQVSVMHVAHQGQAGGLFGQRARSDPLCRCSSDTQRSCNSAEQHSHYTTWHGMVLGMPLAYLRGQSLKPRLLLCPRPSTTTFVVPCVMSGC